MPWTICQCELDILGSLPRVNILQSDGPMRQIQRPFTFCTVLSYTPRDTQHEIDFRRVHYTYSELLNGDFKSPKLVLGSVNRNELSMSNHTQLSQPSSASHSFGTIDTHDR